MSPQQPGHLGCFNGTTPKRHVKDEKSHYVRSEFIQSSPARSCYVTPTSKGRSRRLFVSSRPSSEELFSISNRRYSYSEPMCFSAGSSPVSKAPLFCKSMPNCGFQGAAPESLKQLSSSQNMRRKKYGFRQQQNQSLESLKSLADRFASSRYSDSPKAKQVPLPPVDWINDGSSLHQQYSNDIGRQSISGSPSGGSLVLFSPSSSPSFSSRFSEDSDSSPRYSPDIMLEREKICRATPMHMNALKLIEAVSAS